MICETMSHGAKGFISFKWRPHRVDLHLTGSAMVAAGVIPDENTNKPMELTDSTIRKSADFFTGIYSCFWCGTKITVKSYSSK